MQTIGPLLVSAEVISFQDRRLEKIVINALEELRKSDYRRCLVLMHDALKFCHEHNHPEFNRIVRMTLAAREAYKSHLMNEISNNVIPY